MQDKQHTQHTQDMQDKDMHLQEMSAFEAVYNLDDGLIKDVAVLGQHSKNKRFYSEKVLKESVSKFAGVAVYVNHSDEQRGVEERLGTINNPYYDATRKQIRGDLTVLTSHSSYAALKEDYNRNTGMFGLSPDIYGKVVMRADGILDVTAINKVLSVDLVSGAATVTSLKEQHVDMPANAANADNIDIVSSAQSTQEARIQEVEQETNNSNVPVVSTETVTTTVEKLESTCDICEEAKAILTTNSSSDDKIKHLGVLFGISVIEVPVEVPVAVAEQTTCTTQETDTTQTDADATRLKEAAELEIKWFKTRKMPPVQDRAYNKEQLSAFLYDQSNVLIK